MPEQNTEPPQCSHPHTEVRKKVKSDGTKAYRLQCLVCGGGIGPWIKSAKVQQVWLVKEWDGVLEIGWRQKVDEFWKNKRESFDREREEKSAEWWDKYNEYLLSPQWQSKRDRVLARDNYLCQACRVRRATQAHHLTYAHVFAEPLFDLVAICEPCHEYVTRMDRERRVSV